MNKTIILILISLFALLKLSAQSASILKVDSLFTHLTNSDLFSGAVLIADSSGVLLSKGYGFSDRENKIQNTSDTRFDLSSGSKIFTSLAITKLAEQGKLNYTDTIGQYIKGLPQGNVMTIHHLLTHSAGVKQFYAAKGFKYDGSIKNCTDHIPYIRTMTLDYTPGDSCLYSTGGCMILGAVIEKITGLNFQQYITDFLIKPLGLENTCFTPYWTLTDKQREYAIGYRKDSTGYKPNAYNYDYGFVPLSAGGAWSSANDLYKIDNAVFSNKIVSSEYVKLMTTKYTEMVAENYKLQFGYIWLIENSNTECVGHAGNSSGWHTWNYYYPEKQTTIIILTNMGSVDIFDLATQVDKILFKVEKN